MIQCVITNIGENMNEDEIEVFSEVDNDMIETMISYLDTEIKSGRGVHGQFFQIMEDVVLPILRELTEQDVIDDKHLKQHLNELKEKKDLINNIEAHINSILFDLGRVEELMKEK